MLAAGGGGQLPGGIDKGELMPGWPGAMIHYPQVLLEEG